MTEYCSECNTPWRTADGKVVHDRDCSHWTPPEPTKPDPLPVFIQVAGWVPSDKVAEVAAAFVKARGGK